MYSTKVVVSQAWHILNMYCFKKLPKFYLSIALGSTTRRCLTYILAYMSWWIICDDETCQILMLPPILLFFVCNAIFQIKLVNNWLPHSCSWTLWGYWQTCYSTDLTQLMERPLMESNEWQWSMVTLSIILWLIFTSWLCIWNRS